jgi:hypothetical protein
MFAFGFELLGMPFVFVQKSWGVVGWNIYIGEHIPQE